MPPYQRRFYFNGYRRRKSRRFPFRRRRFRTTFRSRKRRQRVRRKRFRYKLKKKLAKIRINQWQPAHIKKCKISGYLTLFQSGHGRFSNDFTLYKESYVPEHEPGGGGWGIQQLTLSNLYVQNCEFMNWWTRSNKGLNLFRYHGCKVTLYRQPETDYIFSYITDDTQSAGKFYYPSFHPMKLLNYNHKIVVPSYKTQPNSRKPYKKKWIHPPKQMKNQWYFQQQVAQFPLLKFAATACSLNNLVISQNSQNNNVTILVLNTNFFQHSAFQYINKTDGYTPKEGTYMYGLTNGRPELSQILRSNVIYLGDTHINDPGDTRGTQTISNYGYPHWGNIFYHQYLLGNQRTFITNQKYNEFLADAKVNSVIGTQGVTTKTEPYIKTFRYNPYKDKGTGNMAYWKSTSDVTQNNWEPPQDPDSIIKGYPFWLMLWGWEDYTRRLGKLRNLDDNYILVLRSDYFSEKQPTIVPLSYSFVHGEGPYGLPPEDITPNDYKNWYPKWRFQKEAIENILMSGPGVCRADFTKNIQAFVKYQFFFKWGGNPATMESVYDPVSQPITPYPSGFNIQNEINDPTTSIQNLIYTWDVRRDFLTQTAQKRISELQTDVDSMFTDGAATSTDVPFPKVQETQTETTQEKEKETLLLQLQQLKQLRQQLQQRFQQLKLTMENL